MLRRYRYLLALARERHFGRAAAACHVSQPTLSNAIRQLEETLGVPIIERGRRFQGFTPEGEVVLTHARRMLAEQDALEHSLREEAGGLAGVLRLGVVPTALPAAAPLLEGFSARHPGVRVALRSMSSRAIARGLTDFELDAGVTYLDKDGRDQEGTPNTRAIPLYTEAYILFGRRDRLPADTDSVPWKQAAEGPLCLLTPDMQNRRIIDAAFQAAGVTVTPAVETNSLINLVALARGGTCASVVPALLLGTMPPPPETRALPLIEPTPRPVIGLVHIAREPPPPLARALAEAAVDGDISAVLEARTRAAITAGSVNSEVDRG